MLNAGVRQGTSWNSASRHFGLGMSPFHLSDNLAGIPPYPAPAQL